MIFSMTGYGSHSAILSPQLLCRVELFSVNGKGIMITIKSSFLDKQKEMQLRDRITEHLKRGNIECLVCLEKPEQQNPDLIDKKTFHQYVQEIDALAKQHHFEKELLLPSFFHLTNLLKQNEILSLEEEQNMFLTIDEAIKNIVAYRKSEGKKLKDDLEQQIDFILQERLKILVLEPQRKQKTKEHLIKELANLTHIDENRFHQELVYYLEKFDIHEELTRLEIHCNYFKEFMNEKNVDHKGKKINFILQEISREINTLGVKANMIEIQQIVVNLKDVVEKMKEQSLNIV